MAYHAYFLLASKSEAKTVSENASKIAHKADDLTLLQSPEADLTMIDGLCQATTLISEKKAERQVEGRKLILAWPTSGERSHE